MNRDSNELNDIKRMCFGCKLYRRDGRCDLYNRTKQNELARNGHCNDFTHFEDGKYVKSDRILLRVKGSGVWVTRNKVG